MKFNYPASLNMWLQNFPDAVSMLCDHEFNNLPGPWNEGSRINFSATPLSKQDQGTYENGKQLPTKQAIYTNTGDEDNWDIQLRMYGWGSFYAELGVDYYKLRIEKYFVIASTYWENELTFQFTQVITTQIPTSVEIPDVYVPEEPPIYVPPPPDDPPPTPDPPPRSDIDPRKFDDHGRFWKSFVFANYQSLEIPSVPITGMSVVWSKLSDNDWFRVTFADGISYDGFAAAWNSYGLWAVPYGGFQLILMRNWVGSGALSFFLKDEADGNTYIYYMFLYNQIWYRHWAGAEEVDLMRLIRKIGPPTVQI